MNKDKQINPMYSCFHCGGEVIWDNDFLFEDFGYDGEGIVHCLHCTDYGADIEYRIRLDGEDDEV